MKSMDEIYHFDAEGRPRINVALFRRVIQHVKEEPKRLEMSHWLSHLDKKEIADNALQDTYPTCGTTACCAGWAYILAAPNQREFKKRLCLQSESGIENAAKELLGLTDEEADIIFTGAACNPTSPRKQLRVLRKEINKVLAARGLKECV